jgi:hypothetical protein
LSGETQPSDRGVFYTRPVPTLSPLATRERKIVQILESFDALHDSRQAGNGGDRGMGGLTPHEPGCHVWDWRPPLCTCAYRCVAELERLLAEMRDGEERRLWWHLNEHFIAVVWAHRVVYVRRKAKHGKHLTVAEPRMERVGDKSDQKLVAAGVSWLAEHWGLRIEPELPLSFLVTT